MDRMQIDSGPKPRAPLLSSVKLRLERLDHGFRAAELPWSWFVASGLLLSLGLLAWTAVKLPMSGRLSLFLCLDYGSNLTSKALLDRGDRPSVDFFYCYALLPLAVERAWFALFGLTPWAYLGATAVCQIGIGWGLAWFLRFARVGLAGASLIFAALPLTIPPAYPNLCHALESLLLIWALAEHVRGRRAVALALVTAATLTKPSMAYVYGLLLLVEIAVRRRRDVRSIPRELTPALIVGSGLVLILSAWFGLESLVRSQLPFQMARLYRTVGYGFFHGNGRLFWLPPDATWRHYVGTPRGFWLAATAVLACGAGAILVRSLRNRDDANQRVDGVILICAVLHGVYVCCFFGGESSWTYYASVLVLGCALLAVRGRPWAGAILFLAFLALLADRSLPREVARQWAEVGARPRVLGLWATPEEAAEWEDLRHRLRDGKAVFLCNSGGAPTLAPEAFEPAVAMFLIPGMHEFRDVRRTAEQIRGADRVVVVSDRIVGRLARDFLVRDCPELRQALGPFRVIWSGPSFDLYERSRD